MKYYLAYGPNLNLVQMRQRCPNARVVGYTYLFGARLVFRGSKNGCFLTTDFQQPWCPSMVGYGVYEISDKDEQALDVYAGVPYFYQKQTMQVQCVWDVTTRREVLHNIEAILYTLPASHPLLGRRVRFLVLFFPIATSRGSPGQQPEGRVVLPPLRKVSRRRSLSL